MDVDELFEEIISDLNDDNSDMTLTHRYAEAIVRLEEWRSRNGLDPILGSLFPGRGFNPLAWVNGFLGQVETRMK